MMQFIKIDSLTVIQKMSSIQRILILFIIISSGYSNNLSLKIGDEAPPIYLFKLEDNKYFKSKSLLDKKNLFVFFC